MLGGELELFENSTEFTVLLECQLEAKSGKAALGTFPEGIKADRSIIWPLRPEEYTCTYRCHAEWVHRTLHGVKVVRVWYNYSVAATCAISHGSELACWL
jgi:hypothetical protein